MGLYYREQFKNGAEIVVWEITESEEQLKEICVLPNDEQEELSYITNSKRRLERLAVRAILDIIFQEKVYLGYHENGRPFLQNSIVEISIAHTRRFACVLTHPENSVGIDIEMLGRNFTPVEKKALGKSEKEFLSDRPEVRQLQLALIWSAKEALFKYISQTEVDFIEQIEISRFTPREEGEIEAVFYHRDGMEKNFILEYRLVDDHVMVWVVD
ncbi:MAG: 4'-phosphopantetheinyl transferase superfamily protein [Bacteroidales bacterium]|jgi:4'-phosphopantetheinyl transferase|nr:4'-phosphopantetheinyl transferase superfamily protein [Bacteroidales bacterium]MDD2263369.1 4'-phosphopantetheinyl transferase superfamily protein [Bacteroidales bacterium]MDD2830841.1 4'-phosphopantetheinyl transferase superfamily protein [Bacteroidales bacterium]MDD3208040.1 4'-phosphopantetheinyl transferase superfamily protein [Bacteroidales bacterium]MDD3696453.1 4'-phosphopantetheinyl transferase superfamily protein [Bacteroidales bacterium]